MKEIARKYDNLLTKGAKLNFQVFPRLEMADRNLEYLHLSSSAALSGDLKNVCFFNAAFFSTKFSDVTFAQCNLKSIDMCSVWANGCQFLSCDFSEATISDSTFINCSFHNAVFNSISLTRCQFINCSFQDISTDDSTISLNTFTGCRIEGAQFKESFYYQTFENCTFSGVSIAPELLGYNFGFSPELFEELSQRVDLDELYAGFTGGGLLVNAAILRINRLQGQYDAAMIACVAALGQMIQNDILIKADEIEFLKSLTMYFRTRQQIAPISVLRIWQLLNNYFMNESPNTAASKAMPHIREFANTLYFDYMGFQKKLQEQLVQLPQANGVADMAELQIVYAEEPALPLLDCLAQFSTLADSACPEPHLLRTERGSFHEFHEIAVIAIPYVQTLLALLGVVVPIAIYEKQKQDQEEAQQGREDTKQNQVEKEAKQGQGEAAQELTAVASSRVEITLPVSEAGQAMIFLPNTAAIKSETNQLLSDVMKAPGTQALISSADFSGYNRKNIQSITILIQ